MWLVILSWLAIAAVMMIPMAEGGMAAMACLFMLFAYTVVVVVDILGMYFALRRGVRWILTVSNIIWAPQLLLSLGPALMPIRHNLPPIPVEM